jgi:PAS domain S-box-containing protein
MSNESQYNRFAISVTNSKKPRLCLGLLKAQTHSLEMLAQGRPLSEVLTELLRAVEEVCKDGMLTSILLLSEDGKRLVHCAAPSLEPAYMAEIDGAEIGPAAGSCGTAAFLGRPVIVRDIATDPLWKDYRGLALGFGLRACWSVPILAANGKVLGTFAMYYRKPRRPTNFDSHMVAAVTGTAVIAIERVQRTRQLQESEERFRALSACAPVGIFATDLEGQCIYTNSRCNEIGGFSTEEALGRGWAHFIHPDDAERVPRDWNAAMQQQVDYDGEYRWLHRDGQVRWTEVHLAPVKSDSGKLLGYMGALADRTPHLIAEQKATALARELDAVVRFSPVGIVCFDLDLKVRSWNPMAERILGWTVEEVLGTRLALTHAQEDHWRKLREELLRGKAFINLSCRRRHKNGNQVDVLISLGAILDSSGLPTGFVGSVVDTTELVRSRRQLENTVAELKDSEARFHTMADNMDQLVWMADTEGRRFWFNQRWFDYTGTTPEQVLGWGWTTVYHPEYLDKVLNRIRECWASGQTWEDTYPLRGKDGNYRWFLSRALPIKDESGSIIRWFGTSTDITERMMAEETLRQSEKLAIAGKLAANVAHELNNPLAAALNSVYLARQMASDPVQLRHLGNAEQELLRVSRLANRTLSFYPGNSSREQLSLPGIIEELVSVFDPGCAQKNINVSIESDCGVMIYGSKDELRQVFSNLLSNAIDAVGRNGRIRIRLKCLRAGAGSASRSVRVTIADNGHGIPEAHRKKVFEPFFTTKTGPGTGLGLWITKEIISKHDGTISLKSRCGQRQGTVVSIWLPAVGAAQGKAA